MNIVKKAAISLVGLAALVCAGASADQPATRPSESAYAPMRSSAPSWRALRAMNSGKTSGVRPATEQEWDDMMVFMREYSPSRFKVLDSIEIDHNSPVALEAIRKFRNYVFTTQHFPAITDDLRRRFTLEDDLFALMLEDRAAAEGSEALELRDKIHDKIGEIVQLEVKVHQERVDRLQKILTEEKGRLQNEESTEDQTIDRRTDQIIKRLDKHNPDLSPPTTRPVVEGAVEDVPPSDLHDAVADIPNNSVNPDAR
jgi:hypothetical protein